MATKAMKTLEKKECFSGLNCSLKIPIENQPPANIIIGNP